jgi:hypothetical protein
MQKSSLCNSSICQGQQRKTDNNQRPHSWVTSATHGNRTRQRLWPGTARSTPRRDAQRAHKGPSPASSRGGACRVPWYRYARTRVHARAPHPAHRQHVVQRQVLAAATVPFEGWVMMG